MIIVGLLAATLTTSAFLPQMIKTWRTKSAKDVSYTMLITFIIGIFLWLIYGILRQDIAIILANAFTLLFNLTILYLKIKYGRTSQKKRL
ncbi:MAG: SemiSWEET transporter [Richelia sp. RM2_1_2]|nr:SemiSWEET transporter [Richelia sp. RM1_1_1]NJO27147.1 SemiSWEET transporter [Richelia sp. SL_2_1]NJO60287.1 SemiSWEET transporter [Richelia sp. RM2_1_2]